MPVIYLELTVCHLLRYVLHIHLILALERLKELEGVR